MSGKLKSDRVRTIVALPGVTRHRAFVLARRGSFPGMGLLCAVIVLNMNVESHKAASILLNTWISIAMVAALWRSEEATPSVVSL
jgi:hypothetical protein